MSGQTRKIEPGVGNPLAPIGSPEWADKVRLTLGSLLNDLDFEAKHVTGYFVLLREHRAWTLMDRKDGSSFESLEEFCATPRPWGLGKPWPELLPHLFTRLNLAELEALARFVAERIREVQGEAAQ